jgi:isopentenyl-diphosphate delta-isomerase
MNGSMWQRDEMADKERVILVDADDSPLGIAEKLEAHRRGLRHRAVSVIIRNEAGEMLIQKRAREKYHSAGLWANTCCGHPRPDETVPAAALRRLSEEMGFCCELQPLLRTAYRASVDNGLIEDEVCHLLAGRYSGPINPDPAEVEAYKWVSRHGLIEAIALSPENFAPWFRIYMQGFAQSIFAD